MVQGNLLVPTIRLLKVILPDNCLWTSLRDCEGLSYEKTLKELKELYPAGDDDDADINPHGLSSAVPEAILSMVQYKGAVESLGSMIWYLRTLNIDKDILSMKNFNVYDPMKKGQGLMLDGQTLAHVEARVAVPLYIVSLTQHRILGLTQQRRHGGWLITEAIE